MTATDIRVLRARYQISQKTLAQGLGIPQTRLSHLENRLLPLSEELSDRIRLFFAAIEATRPKEEEGAHV